MKARGSHFNSRLKSCKQTSRKIYYGEITSDLPHVILSRFLNGACLSYLGLRFPSHQQDNSGQKFRSQLGADAHTIVEAAHEIFPQPTISEWAARLGLLFKRHSQKGSLIKTDLTTAKAKKKGEEFAGEMNSLYPTPSPDQCMVDM
jgi:hypothetical protein